MVLKIIILFFVAIVIFFATFWLINKLFSTHDKNKKLKNQLRINKEQEKLKELIQEKVSGEIKEIKKIDITSGWFNSNCAIIINEKKFPPLFFWKKNTYSLWIVAYEPAFGKMKERVNCFRIAKGITPIKEKWKEVIENFKKALDSDHPVAEIYNNCYINELPPLVRDYKNVIKSKIELSPKDNPNNFLKPCDIVKVDRKGGKYQHAAIYLGNKKVAHIPDTKNPVRIDSWEEFLKGAKEIEIHHPFIPFKRPELIKKHIEIAVKAGYGTNNYHLLKDNCEHFATMCVYGLGICRQKNVNTLNEVTKGSDYLLQAIKESNEFFEELEKEQMQKETWVEVPPK